MSQDSQQKKRRSRKTKGSQSNVLVSPESSFWTNRRRSNLSTNLDAQIRSPSAHNNTRIISSKTAEVPDAAAGDTAPSGPAKISASSSHPPLRFRKSASQSSLKGVREALTPRGPSPASKKIAFHRLRSKSMADLHAVPDLDRLPKNKRLPRNLPPEEFKKLLQKTQERLQNGDALSSDDEDTKVDALDMGPIPMRLRSRTAPSRGHGTSLDVDVEPSYTYDSEAPSAVSTLRIDKEEQEAYLRQAVPPKPANVVGLLSSKLAAIGKIPTGSSRVVLSPSDSASPMSPSSRTNDTSSAAVSVTKGSQADNEEEDEEDLEEPSEAKPSAASGAFEASGDHEHADDADIAAMAEQAHSKPDYHNRRVEHTLSGSSLGPSKVNLLLVDPGSVVDKSGGAAPSAGQRKEQKTQPSQAPAPAAAPAAAAAAPTTPTSTPNDGCCAIL